MNKDIALMWILEQIRIESESGNSNKIDPLYALLCRDLGLKEAGCGEGCVLCESAVIGEQFSCFRFNLKFDSNKICRFYKKREEGVGEGERLLW